MNLLEQSMWWIAPYALVMVVMLHAMMEFTVSLLVQRPPKTRKPISADELKERLLANANEDGSNRLEKGKDCDLEIAWESGELPQPGRKAFSRGVSRSHIRLLLDDQRHELRINQVSRSYFYFIGMVGWLPRVIGYASAQSGPPGTGMTKEISRIANRFGWTIRPVLWWFQATHSGYHFLDLLTPKPLRLWPARRFWGILYPLSYFLGVGYLIVIAGGLNRDNLVMLIIVSAGWWGTWGILAWALLGFPAFWRGRHR